jgi:antitoxin CptB
VDPGGWLRFALVWNLSPVAHDIADRDRYMNARPAPSGLSAFARRTRGTMTGTARSSAGLDPRRRALLYRAWHRGSREMDLILGRFADAAITDLTDAELGELERLVDVPDPELYGWVAGSSPVSPDYDFAVLARLRRFHQTPSAE